MCMTDSEGVPIWKRGGRVKDLKPLIDTKDTPSGALRAAAKELHGVADSLQAQAEQAQQNANEKCAQAVELETAADKIEGK